MIFIMKTPPLHSSNRSQLGRDSFLIVFGRRLALPLFFLCAAVLPCAATTFQWDFTGSLHTARYYHTATLLSDGRVLVAGGTGARPETFPYPGIASTELYGPATGTWTATGSLTTARQDHKAALLTNGMVLVAGGSNFVSGILASAELYDPATGNWTGAGRLNVARWHHTATSLSDGTVLVAGGLSRRNSLASAEIYDPATGNWTAATSLNNARGLHTATLLSDGSVLAAGGNNNGAFVATAELYGPAPSP